MRDHIISEIRRVAAENGGDPPGRQTFLRETGIKQSAWLGRYWPRWGDALREAGLDANELQTKTSDDFVLRKVAETCRHYGRVPTFAELRMHRNVDPSIPWHSTIANHFPTKAALLAGLREWVARTGSFDDVRALLPPAKMVTELRAPRATTRDGSVYLLRSGAHFKIGKSDEIERRLKEIRVALPEATHLEHVIQTDDPSGIEAYWHRRFADRRRNGEWFALSPADVLAFKRRKFQ